MTLAISNTVPTASELQSYKIIAEVAANNQYWRKLGGGGTNESIVATILSVMLLARELGISPIQAISGGINNINGKFEISARLMNQLIRRHGHKIEIKLSNDQVCSIWSKRKDTGEEHTESYSIEEAVRSGLVRAGSPWQKVPTDMLFARCISRLARRMYADAIGGCYIEGELQESINGGTTSQEALSDIQSLKKEIEVAPQPVVPEPIILLDLPDDVDEELVNIFIEESAATSKNKIQDIKARAAGNMPGFLKAFHVWKEKKYPDAQEEELLEVEG